MIEAIKWVRGKKPSTTCNRSRKALHEMDLCFECGNQFKKSQLEVEHEIPVCIGGDVEKFRIFCKQCHKRKTSIDVGIIAFFKNTGFINKVCDNWYDLYIPKETIIRFYQEIYHHSKLARKEQIKNETWRFIN